MTCLLLNQVQAESIVFQVIEVLKSCFCNIAECSRSKESLVARDDDVGVAQTRVIAEARVDVNSAQQPVPARIATVAAVAAGLSKSNQEVRVRPVDIVVPVVVSVAFFSATVVIVPATTGEGLQPPLDHLGGLSLGHL